MGFRRQHLERGRNLSGLSLPLTGEVKVFVRYCASGGYLLCRPCGTADDGDRGKRWFWVVAVRQCLCWRLMTPHFPLRR